MENGGLGEDEWRLILARLPVAGLARAACVCRSWREFAGDPSTLAAAFGAAYKLRGVVGKPLVTSFWQSPGLGCFAISHTVCRSDTVVGLAIRYQVQVSEIRRLNNMMSDHGIHARERVLVPVTRPQILQDQVCYIERDFYSRREIAVIYPDGFPPGRQHLQQQELVVSRFDKHKLKSSVFHAMQKSLRLDEETAHYYLSLAQGDLKAAMAELKQDLEWEEGESSAVDPASKSRG